MTIRVATVLSARDWEPNLVAYAHETAALRVVLRAYQPREIEERVADIDVVVAGAAVAWVTQTQISTWRRLGLAVVGIHPPGDRPAIRLLEEAGAHEILSDDLPIEAIAQAVRFIMPAIDRLPAEPTGETIAVVGPRGAPGCTEVALATAWSAAGHTPTVLLDLDLNAPSLAIRLGLPPRPDITDVADGLRLSGSIAPDAIQRVGNLEVIVGSHRLGEPPLRSSMVEDVVDAAAASWSRVVLDLGAAPADDPLLKRADHAVLVVDGSAVGLVRGARLASEWSGPPPILVLNRVESRATTDVIRAARRWTGLEPTILLRQRSAIRRAALAARPPDRKLARVLSRIGSTQ